ncbi:hypothetical protein [Mycobacterium sp.]|uniref:hypothetical protein n=1 Tax=Mycobacterium sp. TaxID=1785 RepID=UPI003D14179A
MTVEEFVHSHRATGPLKLRVFGSPGPSGTAPRCCPCTAVLPLHGARGGARSENAAVLDVSLTG